MSDYNISSYIITMQNGFAEDNKKEAAGRLLLDTIATQPSVNVDVEAKMISNLRNRKAEIHDAIKTASARQDVITKTVDNFINDVVPKLNPHTYADSCERLISIMDSDNTVSASQRTRLSDLYQKDNVGEFLAYSFLYAINRQNKSIEAPVEYDDIPLLSEVSNECPICHNPLVKNIKGQTIKKYSIVKIYPDNLSSSDAIAFSNAVTPSKRPDSNDNKISLCDDCALDYEIEPEIDSYIKLCTLKQECVRLYRLQQKINSLNLEEEITTVINGLSQLKSTGNLNALSMEALAIDKKILAENALLKHSITNEVLTYYRFIEDTFSQIDTFNIIAEEIKTAFLEMDRLYNSQDEIVTRLATWIVDNTGMGVQYMVASHIIVSFFIQNCEVFYEIS